MTIYGYKRVSTDEQVKGTSLQTQKTMIEGVAKSNLLDENAIVWLEEKGISGGKKFFERPAVEDIEFEKGDIIIVAALDRFNRDVVDCLTTVKEFKKLGISLIINGHGDVTDDTNIYSTFMMQIMAVFAEWERVKIKERQTRGIKEKRERGGYLGGMNPWGCDKIGKGQMAVLQQKPERRRAIEAMVRLNSEGKGSRPIADYISKKYMKVSHQTVIHLLDELGCEKGQPV
jgi:DNA invertase Pin-like site-specific DNA recombinase